MEDIKQRIREAAARNEALLVALAETDHAAPDLEQHIRFLGDIEFQVSESDARVVELEAQRKKELRDHEKYNNSVMRRFLYKVGGKRDEFDARAAREEREYFDALTAEHRERVANTKLHAQLEAAITVRDELVGFLHKHKAAQDELDNLYHSIFAGPSGPSFPEEDEKEQEANTALQEYHATRTRVECEQQADRLLRSSLDHISQANMHLNRVLDHRCVDLWSISSVHSIHDVTERNMLSDAAAELAHAYNLVVQASRFSPYVSPDNIPRINLDMNDLMAEVLFGNVFTDMALHMQVRTALDEMKVVEVAVLHERTSAMGRLDVLEVELRRRERQLAETREALLEVRMQAFKRVADEMERGAEPITSPVATTTASPIASVSPVAVTSPAASTSPTTSQRHSIGERADGVHLKSAKRLSRPQEYDDGWWRSGLSGDMS